uniref:Bifunctional inhibitor/plant lipid transfer protein/seed storage helical domain-containing protein n=1 Tax=Setaria viridis TaxID=4556 RepID=A0A4U6VGF3_SETVI|nr:hypothetical protein SEVIR_3G335000v2 [Setaria viridis]
MSGGTRWVGLVLPALRWMGMVLPAVRVSSEGQQRRESAELPCTEQQKKDILETCFDILTRGSMRIIIPPKYGSCFMKVREVSHNDMSCIIKLLTFQEHIDYVETRIQKLEHQCTR